MLAELLSQKTRKVSNESFETYSLSQLYIQCTIKTLVATQCQNGELNL